MTMGILKGIGKGLGSLMRRGRGPNRRLTPEEVAQRNLMEAKQATQAAKGRYEAASTHLDEVLQPYRMKDSWTPASSIPRYAPSTAMRAKQVGDETMKMIKDSIMKMDLPAAKKVEAIKSAATAVRNATPAQLAKADPAQLSMDIIKMVGAGGAGLVGGIALEGAAREGRLPEMIQDSFLVRPEFRGMREPSQAVGKMMDATQMGYDMPDPEPGLGQGMVSDLFLDPMIDKLLGD